MRGTTCATWVAAAAVVAAWGAMPAAGQDAPKPVPGKVAAVTLYRGQAQVTRTVPVAGGAGASEVVVGPLPAQVVPDSLFAEGGEGVHVRAVRYRASGRAGAAGAGACPRHADRPDRAGDP